MTVDVEALERRVAALEKAQKENRGTLEWVSGTLGKIAATQDNHTARLDKIDSDLSDLKGHVQRLEGEFNTFRKELPGQIADVMREVLRETR